MTIFTPDLAHFHTGSYKKGEHGFFSGSFFHWRHIVTFWVYLVNVTKKTIFPV